MISENISQIQNVLPKNVCLVAVSKTKPASAILEAYHAGQRDFGENKAQELADKFSLLPKDIRWHFIGHLQTNKIKQVIDKAYLIHSLDRVNLFSELEKQASSINKKVEVLLQFYIAQEESKHGFDYDEAIEFLNSDLYQKSKFVSIVGVMGMATFTDNHEQITSEFDSLKRYFDQLKSTYFEDNSAFKIISMGMSGDYELAIKSGSNLIRVGSAIFGER